MRGVWLYLCEMPSRCLRKVGGAVVCAMVGGDAVCAASPMSYPPDPPTKLESVNLKQLKKKKIVV